MSYTDMRSYAYLYALLNVPPFFMPSKLSLLMSLSSSGSAVCNMFSLKVRRILETVNFLRDEKSKCSSNLKTMLTISW